MTPPATRLLIATTVAAGDADSLPPLIRGLIAASTERLLITPPLEGRLHWLVSDTEAATHQADERLNVVLDHLNSLPAPTSGLISDDSPITAFDDAVRQFRPDHILIGVRTNDRSGWQEHHLIDRLRHRFHIPLTIFEINQAGRVPMPEFTK